MPRPIWSGHISFGLVNIPVKLFSAIKKTTISFHQLRRSDGCRIRLKKVCPVDEKEVSNEEIVKGYEVSPDNYVIITQAELDSLVPQANRSIDIEDFVLLTDIDPLYYNQSYYLVPDKGAGKAYNLLQAAMEQTEKVAIARFILRNKQHLSAIRPHGKTLTLSTMYYPDEIVNTENLETLPVDNIEPTQKELAIATQLIQSLTATFEPGKYRDEYQEKILAMIEDKSEGQQIITQAPVQNQQAKVVDLMAALEASLNAMKKKAPAKDKRRKARAQ